MPLPMFLIFGGNIYEHLTMAFDTVPYEVPYLGVTMPIMIVYLLGNVISQYPFLVCWWFCMQFINIKTISSFYLWCFASVNSSDFLAEYFHFFVHSRSEFWLIFFLNNCSRYLCISSVYRLTTECSSLTVTLVLTLRKFGSLVFSLWYFNNPFTVAHWVGTILVFLGTLIFTEIPQKVMSAITPTPVKKEKIDDAKQKKKKN